MLALVVRRFVAVLTVSCVGMLAYALPATASTYVPNCGTTYYLGVMPDYWSAGCTGGSLNIVDLGWKRYEDEVANAVGVATLRKPCGSNPTCPEAGAYRASARLRLWHPLGCSDGGAAGARFFSQVQVRI